MSKPLVKKSPSVQYLDERFILSIKHELDEKTRLYEELPAQIEELVKRFNAAMVFAPPGFDPAKPLEAKPPEAQTTVAPRPIVASAPKKPTPAKPPVAEKPIGWRRGLQILLEEQKEGMTHQALLKEARAKYQLPASEGEKGFYNAIAKLVNAGSVVKYGFLLFTAANYAQKERAGDLPPLESAQRKVGTSADLIREVLKKKPDGLTGPELRKIMASIPEAPKSLRDHGQYIYNILGNMMGAGDVVKENSIYRLTGEVKK